MRTTNIARIVAVLAVTALLGVLPAKATLSFSAVSPNDALSAYTGPYGTVNVTWDSTTTATVKLTAASGFSFGDGGTVGLNLTGGGTIAASGFSGFLQDGTTPIPTTFGGNNDPVYSVSSGNEDGFGAFTFQLDTHDGASFAATVLQFTITTTGSWANEGAMLTPNGDSNAEVAVHVFPIGSSVLTGYASTVGISPTPVPEPTTLLAGILLLLPFGASTVRVLRKSRKA